jgi:uncharacterized damage-inducible protein DinB
MPDHDRALREHLLYLLRGGGAHVKFEDAIKDFPAGLRGKKPRSAPHTAWQLLEHMRLAQWDILDFSVNPHYKEKEWPAGYWPKTAAPPDEAAWEKSVRAFRADARKMQALVENPATDLFAPIPWGDGQTVLREALLVADHNAYHLGQVVTLRRLLGSWTP